MERRRSTESPQCRTTDTHIGFHLVSEHSRPGVIKQAAFPVTCFHHWGPLLSPLPSQFSLVLATGTMGALGLLDKAAAAWVGVTAGQ